MNTPWINFREMREVSSKQNKYTDWAYQTKNNEAPEDVEESTRLSEIEDESPTTDPIATHQDIPSPSETTIEEDNKPPLGIDENPLEDHVASDQDLVLAEGEIENFLHSDQNLEEKIALPEQSDANEGIPISGETNMEGEIAPSPNIDTGALEESILTKHVLLATETNREDGEEFPSDYDESRVEEHDLATHSDAESTIENKRHCEDIADTEKNNSISKSLYGEVYSITKKCPFSTYLEITNFLHAPMYGEHVQNTTFEFLDKNDHLTPQFETKLFHTTADYPDHPECRLVRSDINQLISIMKTDMNNKNNMQHRPFQSVVTPVHNSQSIEKGGASFYASDLMHIRVPVVVGEYKIELCLEEIMEFEKGIVGVKEISNKVVLTNCRFIPIRLSQSLGNGTCTAIKGKLLIEGYIEQNIEYSALNTQNESITHANRLCQNIVLELIIHMLQVQKIRVLYDSPCPGQL
ncbi:BC_2427 family protein [Lysinibacillus fusiformis]|uniref:BC_2427 family protein n=1 Tax=Lysinibacillus fusiformis TaxID=28031 RepID=UPI00381BA94F